MDSEHRAGPCPGTTDQLDKAPLLQQCSEPGLEMSWTSLIFVAKVLFLSLADLFVLVLIDTPFLIMCEGQALETGQNLQLESLINLNPTTGSVFYVPGVGQLLRTDS